MTQVASRYLNSAGTPSADVLGMRDQHLSLVPSMIRRLSMSGGGGAVLNLPSESKGQRRGGNLFHATHLTRAAAPLHLDAMETHQVPYKTNQVSTSSTVQSSFVTPVRSVMPVSGIEAEAAALQQAGSATLLLGDSPGASRAVNTAAADRGERLRVMAPPSGPVSTASASAILISTPSRPSNTTAQGRSTRVYFRPNIEDCSAVSTILISLIQSWRSVGCNCCFIRRASSLLEGSQCLGSLLPQGGSPWPGPYPSCRLGGRHCPAACHLRLPASPPLSLPLRGLEEEIRLRAVSPHQAEMAR